MLHVESCLIKFPREEGGGQLYNIGKIELRCHPIPKMSWKKLAKGFFAPIRTPNYFPNFTIVPVLFHQFLQVVFFFVNFFHNALIFAILLCFAITKFYFK